MHVDAVGFLACGWSLASERTHGTSIAVQTEEQTILVDAGGDVSKQLLRAFGFEGLEHIYLTHEHPDHTWGLPGLLHCLRFAGERGALEIHGPPGVIERARAAVDALGVTTPFEVRWSELEPSGGEDDRATWHATEHSVPTVAYRFGDVVICGDTAPSDAVTSFARDASLLVHEATHTDAARTHDAGHSTPADAGTVARKADAGALAIIHVHPSLPIEEAVAETGFEPTLGPVDGQIAVRDGHGWQLTR